MIRHHYIDSIPGSHLSRSHVPDLSIAPADWTKDALCAQVDMEMFFPEKGGSTLDPKSVCRECPVIAECLAYAIDNHERYGVWGGTTERERRRIRLGQQPKKRQVLPCGTTAAFRRHERRGETPCDACREARNRENARRWAEKRGAA